MQNCENCNQPFSIEKINSHYAYCVRNFKKCPDCTLFYDINQKQEHDQQYHTYQNCEYCNKRINRCIKRPIQCEYCENNVDSQQFERHAQKCGARTQYCYSCGSYVMIKDKDSHLSKCYPKVQNKFKFQRLDGRQVPINKQQSFEDEEDWQLQEAIKQSLNY